MPIEPKPKLLAALNAFLAALSFCTFAFLCLLLVVAAEDTDPTGRQLFGVIVVVTGGALVYVLLYAATATGLMLRRKWAYSLHVIGAVAAAFTVIGLVYTLFVLYFDWLPESQPTPPARRPAPPPIPPGTVASSPDNSVPSDEGSLPESSAEMSEPPADSCTAEPSSIDDSAESVEPAEQEPLHMELSMTLDDVVDARVRVLEKTNHIVRTQRLLALVLGVIVPIFCLLIALVTGYVIMCLALGVVLTGMAIAVALSPGFRRFLRKGLLVSTKKHLAQVLGSSGPIAAEYELSATHLTHRTDFTEIRVPLRNLTDLVRNPNDLEVWFRGGGLVILRDETFSAPEEIRAWHERIEQAQRADNE